MTVPRCVECPKDISLTKEGVLRAHQRDIWLGGPNYRTEPCPGSGKAPRDILRIAVGRAEFSPPVKVKTNEPLTIQFTIGRAEGTAPRGAVEAQRRAYAKMGLTWSPQAIRERADRWRRKP